MRYKLRFGHLCMIIQFISYLLPRGYLYKVLLCSLHLLWQIIVQLPEDRTRLEKVLGMTKLRRDRHLVSCCENGVMMALR